MCITASRFRSLSPGDPPAVPFRRRIVCSVHAHYSQRRDNICIYLYKKSARAVMDVSPSLTQFVLSPSVLLQPPPTLNTISDHNTAGNTEKPTATTRIYMYARRDICRFERNGFLFLGCFFCFTAGIDTRPRNSEASYGIYICMYT